MFFCAFLPFWRVFTRCLCCACVYAVCAHQNIPKALCASAVNQQNNGKILINYSCLIGPYTSFCWENSVCLLLHLQMKLFAIPVESFPTMFILRFVKSTLLSQEAYIVLLLLQAKTMLHQWESKFLISHLCVEQFCYLWMFGVEFQTKRM